MNFAITSSLRSSLRASDRSDRNVTFDETDDSKAVVSPLSSSLRDVHLETGRNALRTPSPPPPSLDPADSPSLTSSFRKERLSQTDDSQDKNDSPRRVVDPKLLSPKHRDGILTSPHLRSNLMREQKERDPLFYYEVTRTLGVGSMGSVARVRKRQVAVGGSARKSVQNAVKKQKRNRECLKIPFIGGLFRLCIDDNLKHDPPKHARRRTFSNSLFHSGNSSVLQWITEENGNESYGSGNNGNGFKMTTETHDMNNSGRSLATTSSSGMTANISAANVEYAMKSIHLSRVTDEMFIQELENEIKILRSLDHPHIVRPIETFFHRNQIFIIMELCSGGDLYSRDPYTEEEAARIVSSILSALVYMHGRNIAHRDLKYENILFVNDSPKAEIKLIDFGLSKVYGDNAQLTDGVGTIYTMAPEVLKGTYTQKADIWSVGVLAYMLLSSQMPFYGRKRRHIVEQILNCQYDFRGRRWKRISQQAKNFIEELLVFDPEERLEAVTALSCTWLNKRFAATTRAPDEEEETMARHAMLRYAGYTKLKKMALMVVAHKSTCEEIGILRKVFEKYDSRRDGQISYEEFSGALSESGHSPDDLRAMFEAVDLDGSGRIRYTEFLAATIEAQGAISEERLAEAFDRLDSDDSGFISAENLAEILGDGFPREEIDEIIREVDKTKDNRVSYSDFLQLWEQKHEEERQEALKLLGNPTHLSSVSLLTDSRSNPSLSDENSTSRSTDSVEEREAAEARATFLHDKHISVPQVAFADTVIAIGLNDEKEQRVLDDEPLG